MMISILVLVLLASIGDAISTFIALRLPGLREANPIAAWVMARFGLTGWILLRMGAAVAAIWGLWAVHRDGGNLALFALWGALALLAFTFWVVVNNIKLIQSQKGS